MAARRVRMPKRQGFETLHPALVLSPWLEPPAAQSLRALGSIQRKLLWVLVSSWVLSAALACDRGTQGTQGAQELGPETEDGGALLPHDGGAQPAAGLASVRSTEIQSSASTPQVEHLLQPFEMFAPDFKPVEAKKEGVVLPAGLDPCTRNALGQPIRQQPVLYGAPELPSSLRSEFFEGVGGPDIEPSCFRYGDRETHGYTFTFFSQLLERTPERLITWNDLPGVVQFEAESKLQDDHLRLEVRAQPSSRSGHTYWLDHCVGQSTILFNERTRYYYFNPEPVEIDFQGGGARAELDRGQRAQAPGADRTGSGGRGAQPECG